MPHFHTFLWRHLDACYHYQMSLWASSFSQRRVVAYTAAPAIAPAIAHVITRVAAPVFTHVAAPVFAHVGGYFRWPCRRTMLLVFDG